MLNIIKGIIAKSEGVPKRLFSVIASYILFLSLHSSKHSLQAASKTMAKHKSSFSRLLCHPGLLVMSQAILKQSIKEILTASQTWLDAQERIFIIIDATLIGRRGKKVENKFKFKEGSHYVDGHKFVNVLLLINDQPLCLCSIPFYSKQYCAKRGLDYFTENELVEHFVMLLPGSGLLAQSLIAKLCFLLDAGYDAKIVQNAIRHIGSHFVGACQIRRCINGIGISEYFRLNRCLSWKSHHISHNVGKRSVMRRYRARHAAEVELKGVGLVTAVCSEKRSGVRQPKRKYLVCSDERMSVREIILAYSKRWIVEVWHKRIKQRHGYRDCTSRLFNSVEAHVTFVVCGYNIRSLVDKSLFGQPRTCAEHLVIETLKEAYRCSLLFGGRNRLKQALQKAQEDLLAA